MQYKNRQKEKWFHEDSVVKIETKKYFKNWNSIGIVYRIIIVIGF